MGSVKKPKGPEIIVKTTVIKPEDINEDSLRYLSRDSFALWALNKGITVDHHKFSFDDFKFLRPLYMDNSLELVLVKAAQLGATVYQILWLIWFLEQNQGTKAGLYFPNKDLADNTSKDRITPMLESSPEIYEMTDPSDKLALRKIGKSSLYVMYLEGKSSRDSVPLDALSFDEVRLSSQMSIDQTMERIAASKFKYRRYMSTCGYPNDTIHKRFLRGTQHIWMSKCACFSYDEKIWVRHNVTKHVTCLSFKELQHCWDQYEALSKGSHKKAVFKPITAFHHNGERPTKKVTLRNGLSVTCTEDHTFFYQAKTTKKNGNSTRGRIKEIALSEIPLNNRYKNKLVCVDKIPASGYNQPYDNDTLFTLGAYIAEGSSPAPNQIDIAQKKDTEIRHLVPQWALRNNVPCYITDTVLRLSFSNRPDLWDLFTACGRSCDKKEIPETIMHARPEQLVHLLRGYLTGDGHYIPEHRKVDFRGFKISTVWSCVTTSEKLAAQLQKVCLKLGTPVHTSYREPSGKRPIWTLEYNPKSAFASNLVGGDFSSVSICAIEDNGVIPVCDITVADNHTYVLASGVIAHNCTDGVDLARTFPHCVVDDPKRGVYLRCPKCKYTINDTQNGRYVPHNPGADVHSYSVSQLASKRISIKEIWEFYKTTTNIAEFYNGKLGLPWVDEDNRGVSMDQLKACVDDTQFWGREVSNSTGCAMGVDQGAGYVVAVIGDLMDNGKKRIRHVEIIENNNPRYFVNGEKVTPFLRLRELMKEFDVRLCVVDAMPNSNDALQFAQDFRSRVFLAWYQRDAKHVVQWGDKRTTGEGIRKAGSFLKFKYTVTLSRYLSMGAMLGAWEHGNYVIPEPSKLVQICRSEETTQLIPLSPAERLFDHHCRLIKQFTVTNEDTGEGKHEWIYTGGDPHLSHASNYLNVGLERLGKRVLFTFA